MNIVSTVTLQSKAIPGVTVRLHKRTVGRRQQLEQAMLPLEEVREGFAREIRELQQEYFGQKQFLPEEIDALTRALPPERETAYSEAMEAILARFDREYWQPRIPVILRWAIRSIDGLDIDGKPATPDSLYLDGADEAEALIGEIMDALQGNLGLSADESKNSESPSTSPAVEGMTQSSTTAGDASLKG